MMKWTLTIRLTFGFDTVQDLDRLRKLSLGSTMRIEQFAIWYTNQS